MKKRLITFLTISFLAVCFTGCGKDNSISSSTPSTNPFETISEENCLVYDKNTRTIYYLFSTDSAGGFSYGYMAPYIQNGHYCEYVDGQIVEVTE